MKSYKDVLCLECGEEVFNPLCPDCLAREIKVWLNEKPPRLRKQVETEIKNILKFCKNNEGYTKCISCKGNKVFLCPYCFTERVYRKLKDSKASKREMKEFLSYFNFDLEHTGYSHDIDDFEVF